MSTPRRLALATATALTTALLLPAAPAHAAYPSPNTVYRDTVEGDDFSATVRIKIGSDKKTIAKFTTVVHCPGRSKPLRVIFKNIKIHSSGTFAQMKKNKTGFTYEARGEWGSAQGVKGQMTFMQNQCPPWGWVPYYAEK